MYIDIYVSITTIAKRLQIILFLIIIKKNVKLVNFTNTCIKMIITKRNVGHIPSAALLPATVYT